MRAIIFGGTTEGRELSSLLKRAGAEVIVCVASEYGEEEQAQVPGVRVRTGPLTAKEKLELLQDVDLCIDATHPYAVHITESVKAACRTAGVEYLRLLRGHEREGDRGNEYGDAVAHAGEENMLLVDGAAEAANWLSGREGNILLTTGTKELGAFAGLPPERLFPRVLPSHESLRACEALNIPHRNIIAMQGPFSAELNAAVIRQHRIRFVVTKESGVPGGFPEKREAARETGTQLIVLRRPAERGLSFEDVLNRCIARLGGDGNAAPLRCDADKKEGSQKRSDNCQKEKETK